MSDSLLLSALTPVLPKLLSWCNLETRASIERITGTWGDPWAVQTGSSVALETAQRRVIYTNSMGTLLWGKRRATMSPKGLPLATSLGQHKPWVIADAAVTVSWNTTERASRWEPRPFQPKFQFYSHHSKLRSPCRKIRYEPAWLPGGPLLSAPVVCQLTGVRATGIAAVHAVVRSNEQEAEQHGLLLFMSSWGIHTLTRAFSLQHTHRHTCVPYLK